MEVVKTKIDGVFLIQPKLFCDERGYFFESFNLKEFSEKVGNIDFVQDNESRSSYGVIRGLHFQKPPFSQSKLVRCIQGAVLDVALDIRKGSPTYGEYVCAILSENNHTQLFIPKGFAHGFSVLTKEAVFQYKCDNYYHPEADGGINVLDNSLHINCGIPIGDAVISEKDKNQPYLESFESPFYY